MAIALGVLGGATLGIVGAAISSAAVAQSPLESPKGILEASHLPPLLTLPGEPVELTYDVDCLGAGDDPEAACDVTGSVFARRGAQGAFTRIQLTPVVADGRRELSTRLSDVFRPDTRGIEYYAVLEAPAIGKTITLPSGGADAPQSTRVLEDAVEVQLGRHAFGGTRAPTARVASGLWGDGPNDLGLEDGPGSAPTGASAFDVDGLGNVVVLDEVHRRALRWRSAARTPVRVPLSIERLPRRPVGRRRRVSLRARVGRPPWTTTARPTVRRHG